MVNFAAIVCTIAFMAVCHVGPAWLGIDRVNFTLCALAFCHFRLLALIATKTEES